MTRPFEDNPLAAILQGLATNSSVGELHRSLEAIEKGPAAGSVDPVLMWRARAEIDNRLGLPDKALAGIIEGRRVGIDADPAQLSGLSTLAARIHAWRPVSEAGAFEALRAVAEAELSGSAQHRIAALQAAAELAVECHRFDTAVALCDLILKSAGEPPVALPKTVIRKLQALNHLGRHADALVLIERTGTIDGWRNRDRFLLSIERVHALAGTDGGRDEAVALLARIEPDPDNARDAFQRIEWLEAHARLSHRDAPEAAVASLRAVLPQYEEDRLIGRLATALITLGDCLARTGDAEGSYAAFARAAGLIARHQLFGLRPELVRAALGSSADHSRGHRVVHALGSESSQRYLPGPVIGGGGGGTVRRGVDLFDGSDCVIKHRRVGAGTIRWDDVRSEFQATARLDHDGINAATDAWVDDNGLHLVSPFVEGGPLDTHGCASWPTERKLAVLGALAQTLAFVHGRELVHCDIKPQNVVLAAQDRPILIDFGIARLVAALSEGATVGGTPGYMAPEVQDASAAARLSPAVDVYAFGIMMRDDFELGPKGFINSRFRRDPYQPLISAMTSREPERRPSMEAVRQKLLALANQ